MTNIALKGGSYTSASIPAAAQRVCNLFQQPTPSVQGEPLSYVDYLTPGLKLISTAPVDVCRCLYRASNEDLYAVYGQNLYFVDAAGVFTLIGTFVPSALSAVVPKYTPVSISDNGKHLLIAMNTIDAWTVAMAGRDTFLRIDRDVNDGFIGSPLSAYQDSFFILSRPTFNEFYISASADITFDALDYASKNARPDPLQGVVSCHRVLWLIGTQSYEVWFNQGGGGTTIDNFPFQLIPSAFTDVGCVAMYSIQSTENTLYWLSTDAAGRGIVLQGQSDYSTKRISTHALEIAISSYPDITDAVGLIYIQNGHQNYMISFPSSNEYRGTTWCFDASTELWHERVFTDMNGLEHRHRAQCATNAYGKIWCGDWANANLYQLDTETFHDIGYPIVRRRTFAHQVDTDLQRRISFRQLTVFMETGTSSATATDSAVPVVDASFSAVDGTLLQNYTNSNDLGASFTKASGDTNGEILDGELVAAGNGAFQYFPAGTPTSGDYSASFTYNQTDYTTFPRAGSFVYVIGRYHDGLGYKASVHSDGTQVQLFLEGIVASPIIVGLGTVTSPIEITLTMLQTNISVKAYRTLDGHWLRGDGTWTATPTVAIVANDNTYSIGPAAIGGTWT